MNTAWFDDIPKVELHVHLEGAIPVDGLFELIRKYGGDSTVPDQLSLQKKFEYRSFAQFIDVWGWKNKFLREYEDFAHIAERVAHSLAEQNIRYAEVLFSPSLFTKHGLQVQEIAYAVRRGLARVPAVDVALIADLVRDYGEPSELEVLYRLAEVRDQGIVGVGIGGTEPEFPPELFTRLFAEARRMGFHTNAHAGEAAGAESVWTAVRDLKVERIGHGTRAVDDAALLDYLAMHRIPVEMCPISNVRTRVVESLARHPIKTFFDKGIPVSVNTDDPTMFQTSLAGEYRSLHEQCGFSRREICTLIELAIQSSWLTEQRKEHLTAGFRQHPDWVPARND